MEKSKLAKILDIILCTALVWLLSMVIIGYYTKNAVVNTLFSSVIAVVVAIVIYFHSSTKYGQKLKKSTIDKTVKSFLFNSEQVNLQYFKDALSLKVTISVDKSCLISNKTAVFAKFIPEKLSLTELLGCYTYAKELGAKRLIVLTYLGGCPDANKLIMSLPNIKADIFDKDKVYSLINWCGASMPEIIEPIKNKQSLRQTALGILKPAYARKYLLFALLLLISSRFMRYSIYYIIIASMLTVLSILCFIDIAKTKTKH